MNSEFYTFKHHDEESDITTELSFTVPSKVGAHVSTIHSMCRKFATALGYSEKSIDEYFGEEGEPFAEYYER